MGGDLKLETHTTRGAKVEPLAQDGWRLSIPAGPAGRYRCAQLDDHAMRLRRWFPWQVPVTLSLHARVSSQNLTGTWGFGFWNDPFDFNLRLGNAIPQLPAAPNTAWFFHAAPPNYLSLRDDLPAQGFLASAFRSLDWPRRRLIGNRTGVPNPVGTKKSPWPFRWGLDGVRRVGSWFIGQDASSLTIDCTEWHSYAIECGEDGVIFKVNGEIIFQTKVTPRGRLGLVLWIDNQYAAFPPGGRLTFGTSESNQPGWLELAGISVT